jgi:hypothetical protein
MKRFILLAAAAYLLPNSALAQVTDCQTIARSSERLACYDKMTPPTTEKAGGPSATAPARPSKGQKGTSGEANPIDLLAVENKRLEAKISNICRGC